MENPDCQKGEIAIKLCDNLGSLSTKLEREKSKVNPRRDILAKLLFQIKACRLGLSRIQYSIGSLDPS